MLQCAARSAAAVSLEIGFDRSGMSVDLDGLHHRRRGLDHLLERSAIGAAGEVSGDEAFVDSGRFTIGHRR